MPPKHYYLVAQGFSLPRCRAKEKITICKIQRGLIHKVRVAGFEFFWVNNYHNLRHISCLVEFLIKKKP